MLVAYFDTARRVQGLTQQDVANRLGISTRTLISYEQGKSTPSLKTAREMAKLYKVPLDGLIQPGDDVPIEN